MESTNQSVSPLRQRMIEDMRMRKLAPRTRDAYIRAVRKFAKFLGRSPDTASDEDLRRFQLHLIDQGTSPITLNATIVGLNFLFEVTLGRPEAMAKMQSVRVHQKLPVILSKEEVTRLIACFGHIKHQTALSLAYGTELAGLAVAADGDELHVAQAALFNGAARYQALTIGQQNDLEHDAGIIGTGPHRVVLELGVHGREVEFVVYKIVQCKGKTAGDNLFRQHDRQEHAVAVLGFVAGHDFDETFATNS